jgi:hypothetical protein
MKKRRGYILLVVLGLLGFLGILVYHLSHRLKYHQNQITLLDARETTRLFLESLARDILFQLQKQLVEKKGIFFEMVKNPGNAGTRISPERFKISDLGCDLDGPLTREFLTHQIDKRHGARIIDEPVVVFSLPESEMRPPHVEMQKGNPWPESEVQLSIILKCRTEETTFRMTLGKKGQLILTVIPVLKDFAWFFDRLSEEQSALPGASNQDGINILPLRFGETADPGIFPLILEPFPVPKQHVSEQAESCVKVFLGREADSIVLNLGGDNLPRKGFGRMSDLWLLKQNHFLPPSLAQNVPPLPLSLNHLVPKPGNIQARNRFASFEIPDVLTQTPFKLHVDCYGFGEEVFRGPDARFLQDSFKEMRPYLEKAPAYAKWENTPEPLKYASALKPYGLNAENRFFHLGAVNADLTEDGLEGLVKKAGTQIPPIEVYGRVMRRFLMLSHVGLGGTTLPFQPTENYVPVQERIRQSQQTRRFAPPPQENSYSTYQRIMSNVVSGNPVAGIRGADFPPDCQGFELSPEDNMRPRTSPRLGQSFTSPEGFRLAPGISLNELSTYLEIPQAGSRLSRPWAHLLSRTCFAFSSGEDFLNYAWSINGTNGALFSPGGIAFIDGDLDLSTGISDCDVRGGIVLVNGNLTLGAVTRRLPLFPPDNSESMKAFFDQLGAISQDQILTFVILPGSGGKLTLTGHLYAGVHLVSLGKSGKTPIAVERPFTLFGALALSRPDLGILCSQLQREGKESRVIYHPALGASAKACHLRFEPGFSEYEFGINDD